MVTKKSMYIVDMKLHLTVQVNGVLIMTLLGMLQVLVLIIVHHFILAIARITF